MITFQNKIDGWMTKCFTKQTIKNPSERSKRFIEEAIELVQSFELPKEDVLKLVDYVYNRPVGNPKQEVGGVLVTLAALCNTRSICIADEGWNELNRIDTPEIIEKVKNRQSEKLADGVANSL